MSTNEYTFEIYYWSEVSATITVRKVGKAYIFEAYHPKPYVSIGDWFHFSDKEYNEYKVRVSAPDILDCLNELGEKLYPGAEQVLKDLWGIEDTRERFFTHLFIAFCYGGYYPRRADATIWRANDAGRKLLNRKS